MQKLPTLIASALLVASGTAAAHPNGFPHHFVTDPNTEHFWLLGSGLEYVFACIAATAVFFALKRISAKKP